jgi:hypothetical protein
MQVSVGSGCRFPSARAAGSAGADDCGVVVGGRGGALVPANQQLNSQTISPHHLINKKKIVEICENFLAF